jgi:hypothetical protein
MSRIENGKRHISAEEVAIILAVYKIPAEQRDAVIKRAKAIDDPGWWTRPLPGVPDELGALASYENEAHAITDWSVALIPGLLQTYEYAKAYMLELGISEDDVEMRWMARLRRQQVVPKVEYTAFIGEAAIRTPFGDTAFMDQLKLLVDATHRGRAIRIVPEHRPHASLLHSWMLLEFPRLAPDRPCGTGARWDLPARLGGGSLSRTSGHTEQDRAFHCGKRGYAGETHRPSRGHTMTLVWRKSSFTGDTNCVELAWRKSSRSETNCVELANTGAVRDSKNPTGPTLTVDLKALLAAVKRG